MATLQRLLLIAISVPACLQGASADSGSAECEPSSADVSLLQLNGALQAIESALEPPAVDKDGHLIHTPNGPRVAHVSHLPVQAAIQQPSTLLEAATRDNAHEEQPHDAPHADDPHAAPAAPVATPPPTPAGAPAAPHSDAPVAPTQTPAAPRVLPGYENAHPADIAEEKYQYLNRLAAFAIGPGMFFLALLVVATFGLFVYAYKNDPRVF